MAKSEGSGSTTVQKQVSPYKVNGKYIVTFTRFVSLPRDCIISDVFLPKKYNPDHVLIAPSYAKREGEPYQIARIMEFMDSASNQSPTSVENETTTNERVRVALFLRPRDISSRYTTENHVVIATMHAEIVDVSQIRMKVTVKHRDQIPKLEQYKSKENNFYYHQVRTASSVCTE